MTKIVARVREKQLSQSAFSFAAGVSQFSQSKLRYSTDVMLTEPPPVCLRIVFNSSLTAFTDDPIVAWRLFV